MQALPNLISKAKLGFPSLGSFKCNKEWVDAGQMELLILVNVATIQKKFWQGVRGGCH